MDILEPEKIEGIKSIIVIIKEEPLLLLVIPVIVISIVIYKAKAIVSFINERKKSKLQNITNALNCENIDSETKEFLEKEVINEHFYLSMGINVEEQLRKAIIQTHLKADGGLSFIHFKRGLQYLSYNVQKKILQVKIAPWDKYANWFLVVISIILLFLGLVIFLVPLAIGNLSFLLFIKSASFGLIFIIGSILSFYQTFSFFSASKIDRELSMQTSTTNQSTNKKT